MQNKFYEVIKYSLTVFLAYLQSSWKISYWLIAIVNDLHFCRASIEITQFMLLVETRIVKYTEP